MYVGMQDVTCPMTVFSLMKENSSCNKVIVELFHLNVSCIGPRQGAHRKGILRI